MTQCGTIAYVDQTETGFCICVVEEGHDGGHRCVCKAEWTDETASPRGRWPEEEHRELRQH